MATKGEVVGWLLDYDAAGVLVREASGHISLQTSDAARAFEHRAIQTGSFRLDELTSLLLLERVHI